MSFRQAILGTYSLMSEDERRRVPGIVILSLLAGVADIAILMVFYPLLSLLLNPETIQSNALINKTWLLSGSPPFQQFSILMAVATSVVVVVGVTFSSFVQVKLNRFAAGCQERLGMELMSRLLNASYPWHLRRNPMVLGNLFQDAVVTWREVIRRVTTMAGQLAAVSLTLAALIVYMPLWGLFGTLLILLILRPSLGLIQRRTARLMKQKREAGERLHVFLGETLPSMKDVKLSSRERDLLDSFARIHHFTSGASSGVNNWNLLPTQIVTLTGLLSVIFICLGLLLTGHDTDAMAAAMAVTTLVALRVIPTLNRMGMAISSVANVSGWVQTLNTNFESLLEDEPSVPPKGKPSRHFSWNKVVLHEVDYIYPCASKPAIHGVSICLSRGGSYAFVGPSGAGKSTIIDVVLGLLPPTNGEIKIDEEPIGENNLRNWQANIGYVPQVPFISDASIRENVAFGIPKSEISDERVKRCLELAQLSTVIDRLPSGLETLLGIHGVGFSGGQRQRVVIARALYKDPEILVLDEATSALDALSESAIRDALIELKGKLTIISIAHRTSTISSFDRIFLVSSGTVVAAGTFAELTETSPLFRELTSQQGGPLKTRDDSAVRPWAR